MQLRMVIALRLGFRVHGARCECQEPIVATAVMVVTRNVRTWPAISLRSWQISAHVAAQFAHLPAPSMAMLSEQCAIPPVFLVGSNGLVARSPSS